MRPTRHVYLDLPALTPQLQAYITASSQAGGWSNNCLQVRPAPSPGASDRAVALLQSMPRPGFLSDRIVAFFAVWREKGSCSLMTLMSLPPFPSA